jgi:hypothetical protein
MMSRLMRVFFGFPAEDKPPDTTIGDVELEYRGFVDRFSLRFSDNSMDVLNLPIPGRDGPESYDNHVLLFERQVVRGNLRFALTMGNALDARVWERRSRQVDAAYKMTSGRPWGVF